MTFELIVKAREMFSWMSFLFLPLNKIDDSVSLICKGKLTVSTPVRKLRFNVHHSKSFPKVELVLDIENEKQHAKANKKQKIHQIHFKWTDVPLNYQSWLKLTGSAIILDFFNLFQVQVEHEAISSYSCGWQTMTEKEQFVFGQLKLNGRITIGKSDKITISYWLFTPLSFFNIIKCLIPIFDKHTKKIIFVAFYQWIFFSNDSCLFIWERI